ncbi:MAG: hypothetical protein ABI690_15850, partial [Chloroflexota bacterium]
MSHYLRGIKPVLIAFICLFMLTFVVAAQDTGALVDGTAEPLPVTDTPTEIPTETPMETPTADPTEIVTETPTEVPTDTATPDVIVPTEEVTQPVEMTSEATLPVDVTPEMTATVAPYPPEPVLITLFNTNFNDGLLPAELTAPGWVMVNTDDGQALQSGDGAGAGLYSLVPFAEGTVQARFLLNSGEARVFLRQNDPVNYTAGLSSDGMVNLYRADVVIQSVQLPLDTTVWHTLRLSAFAGVLRVSVDGLEVITTEDNEPFPPGNAGFSVAAGSIVRADDLSLSVPEGSVVIPPPVEATAEVTPELTPEAPMGIQDVGVTAQVACAPSNQITMVAGYNGAVPHYVPSIPAYWDQQDEIDISTNGRYVAYASSASNLTADQDLNNNIDVFVFDRTNCTNELVSIRETGTPFAFGAYAPSISDDGNFVAFSASDGASLPGIYVRDRQQATTVAIAVSANGASMTPTISGNGRFVVFYSYGSDLVVGDTNGVADVFLYDRDTDTDEIFDEANATSTTRVSIPNAGGEAVTNVFGMYPPARAAVSDNGQFVAFVSFDGNMVPNDNNNDCQNNENCPDVFLRDTVNNTTTLVSVSTTGTSAELGVEPARNVNISANGQYVMFLSLGSNLTYGDNNGQDDVFIRDTVNNTTTQAALSNGGTALEGSVYAAEMSPDGNFIAFAAYAWNANGIAPNSPGGGGALWGIYVYRRDTQQTTFVSKSAAGVAGNHNSYLPNLSADGSRILFYSEATNLVAGSTYAGCETDYVVPYDNNENCPEFYITPVIFPPPFLPPTNLAVTGSTQTQVSLSWADGSSDEQGFRIERSNNFYDWMQLGQVGANVTSFNDNTALCGTTFMYRVRAYKTGTNSIYSSIVSGTTLPCTPQPCDPNAILTRASTGSNGVPQGNGNSNSTYGSSEFSSDGHYVVFASDASNLVPGDTNNVGDIFRVDRQNCSIIQVSLADNEALGDGYASEPAISADGNIIAFSSWAGNLVNNDTNNTEDIFVRNVLNGTTKRISVNGVIQADNYSFHPTISADGRYVAFTSYAGNLAAGDTTSVCENSTESSYDWLDNCPDIFLYDLTNDTLTLISINAAGTGTGNQQSDGGSVVVMGGNPYVVFESRAGDLVNDDSATCWWTYYIGPTPRLESCEDVFIRDVNSGTTTLISRNAGGNPANDNSWYPYAVTDGTNLYVAFSTGATNLVAGDTNAQSDIYLKTLTLGDLTNGTVTRVSLANGAAGAQPNNGSWSPVISDNGRYVAFYSYASNLVPGDSNGKYDIFVRNVATSSTARVSVSAANVAGNYDSYDPSISPDGLWITFYTSSSNLVPGDTNNICEIGDDSQNSADYNDPCQDVFVAQNPLIALKPPTNFVATALSTTSIKLAWTDAANETEYRLEHSTDGVSWTEIQTLPANTITFTDSGLTCASTHYYRIRSYDGSLSRYSSYTAPVSKATLACPVVTAPVQVTPLANAFTNNQSPTFTWNAVANSTSYEIQIASNSTFTIGLQAVTGLGATNYTETLTLSEGVYFWRVRAYNTAVPPVAGPFSTVRSFTVDITPLATLSNLIAPLNQAKLSTTRPTFSWSAAVGATQYRLEVDEDPGFNSPEISQIVKATSYVVPAATAPLVQGVQNWRVMAIDAAGNEGTNWSTSRSFTVFIGTAPLDGVFSVSPTPNFTWAVVAGTTSYTLQVSDDTDFSNIGSDSVINQAVTGVSFKPALGVLAPGTYYWRVLRSGETPADPNVHRTLFIGAAPAAPTLVSPVTG